MKINQIPCVASFFKPQVSGLPLNFASPFSVMAHNSYEIFQLKHQMLWKKRSIKVQFFRFLSAPMKVHPIPHAIFETKSIYSNFSSLFSVVKDNSSVFLQLKPCIFWTKRAHRKKSTKFLVPYLKLQIKFSLNFASLFSVMRNNSSLLFQLKLYMIWTKGTHQSANFRLSTTHMKFRQICTLIGSFC